MWCYTFSNSKISQRSSWSTRIRLSQTQTIRFNKQCFPYAVFTCSNMGLGEHPRGLPATVSLFNPLMNLNCSKRQMDCKRSKHVVALLGGNKRPHCTAPVSSSRALVEPLFSSSLNRSWIETGMRIGSTITPSPDSPLWIHWGCMRSYSLTTTWALTYQSIDMSIKGQLHGHLGGPTMVEKGWVMQGQNRRSNRHCSLTSCKLFILEK